MQLNSSWSPISKGVSGKFFTLLALTLLLLSNAHAAKLEDLIPSRPGLDPVAGETFVVSVNVVFRPLLRTNSKQIIVSKYEPEGTNPVGWSLALNRNDTSVRPEVYWRGEKAGGWFTFDRMEVLPRHVYSFTFFGTPGKQLNLYVQDLGASAKGKDGQDSGIKATPVRFMGGYALAADFPNTTVPVVPGNARSSRFALRGDIRYLLIASAKKAIKNADEPKSLLEGGASELADRLSPAEIRLTLSGEAKAGDGEALEEK